MMDAFFGQWKLTNSKNLDEFLKAIGHGEEIIQVGNIVTPVISIFQEGNKVVKRTKTSIGSFEISFVLGEEFEEDTGVIHCKSVVFLDGDKLVHVQKWNDNSCTITHEMKDGQMACTMKCGSAVAVRTFDRTNEAT